MSIPTPRDADQQPQRPGDARRNPAKPQASPADQWRPYWRQGFEINGLGQLRTVNHKPGGPAP